jgi:hypothetical protein
MVTEGGMRRLDALLAQERERGLSAEERVELQQLMASRTVPSPPPARR